MIPKIIHYVWVGNTMSPHQQAYLDTWRKTNPDFELREWNESNINFQIPLIAEAYRRERWATVADAVRLMAVYEHGGIYLDVDFKLFRPFGFLVDLDCFFSFQTETRSSDWVANGVFGAAPKHWFVEKALTRLLMIRPNPLGIERPTKYGPKLITNLLISHGLDHYSPQGVFVQGIYLCPVSTFFPFHWTEAFDENCVTDETIGAHFWEKSWEKNVPPLVRGLRFARSLFGGRQDGAPRRTPPIPRVGERVRERSGEQSQNNVI